MTIGILYANLGGRAQVIPSVVLITLVAEDTGASL